MNELERLIAALPRPEPSEKLDQRITTRLLAQPPVRSVDLAALERHAGVDRHGGLHVGVVGFFLGRQSCFRIATGRTAGRDGPGASALPPAASPVAANPMRVPLGNEQLASLFLHSGSR